MDHIATIQDACELAGSKRCPKLAALENHALLLLRDMRTVQVPGEWQRQLARCIAECVKSAQREIPPRQVRKAARRTASFGGGRGFGGGGF